MPPPHSANVDWFFPNFLTWWMNIFQPYSKNEPEERSNDASIMSSFSSMNNCSSNRLNYPAIIPKHPDIANVTVELVNKELWQEFYNLTNEMIVTPRGRSLRPVIRLNITKLNPRALYYILLDFLPAARSSFRYNFNKSTWELRTPACYTDPDQVYYHPAAPEGRPETGEFWMKQDVVFDKVKLINRGTYPHQFMRLNSMHKYQPRIRVILVKTADGMRLEFGHHSSQNEYIFEETKFIAVTAYLNKSVTDLKVKYNPYSKGHATKRERLQLEIPARKLQSPVADYCSQREHNSYAQWQVTPFSPYNQGYLEYQVSPSSFYSYETQPRQSPCYFENHIRDGRCIPQNMRYQQTHL